jgi:hypothetical protein
VDAIILRNRLQHSDLVAIVQMELKHSHWRMADGGWHERSGTRVFGKRKPAVVGSGPSAKDRFMLTVQTSDWMNP